jgi:hypothetical protein
MMPHTPLNNHDRKPGWYVDHDFDHITYVYYGEPVALGYWYGCSACRARCFLFRLDYLAYLAIAFTASAIWVYLLHRRSSEAHYAWLLLLIPALLLAFEGFNRWRNPAD